MTKFIFVTLFCVLLAFAFAADETNSTTPKNEANPLVSKILPDASTKYYRFGVRVSGDKLLDSAVENFFFKNIQDVKYDLWYPKDGSFGPYVISYVELNVDQSSAYGNAYVSAGGIGQRKMNIVIEAQKTKYLRFGIKVYGY